MTPQTVQEIMSTTPVTIGPEAEVTQAARLMLEKRINGLPVVDAGGRLVGLICQSDLIAEQKRLPLPSFFTLLDAYIPLTSIKHLEQEVEKIAAATVAQAMTADPVTVGPETAISDAAALMVDRGYHTLPVVHNGQLVGVLGKEDLLKLLLPAQG